MERGILRGAGGDENLKSNFIWPYKCKSKVKIQGVPIIIGIGSYDVCAVFQL